jgi:K+-transporting ATPase KdpF subunit
VRKTEEDRAMSFGSVLLLILCGVLLGYLLFALLRAEEF